MRERTYKEGDQALANFEEGMKGLFKVSKEKVAKVAKKNASRPSQPKKPKRADEN